MKVVINKCYGGFGLSSEAVMRYAELKGMTLYHQKDTLCVHYYKVPVDEYKRLHAEAQKTRNYDTVNELYFSERSLDRDDLVLVQVVEELGEAANGWAADLKVVEIPDGVEWIIDEYDGVECIAEVHRTWS